jgi:hypothetical protein
MSLSHFQLTSDLHLECYKNVKLDTLKLTDFIIPCAKVLLLAGDIGCPWELIYKWFLTECTEHFEFVIVIAGNHSHYYRFLKLTVRLLMINFKHKHIQLIPMQ